ncbi:MAG: hypothetical protein QXQ02_03735 [Halobacteria archaeon]
MMLRDKLQTNRKIIICVALCVLILGIWLLKTFAASAVGYRHPTVPKADERVRFFIDLCYGYCKDFFDSGNIEKLVRFCTQRLWKEGTTKEVGNRTKVDVIEPVEEMIDKFPLVYPYPVCEDAIFCFFITDCYDYLYKTRISAKDCRKILCEYYYNETGGNLILANDLVTKSIQANAAHPWGSCELPLNENWWYKFFGDKPCAMS